MSIETIRQSLSGLFDRLEALEVELDGIKEAASVPAVPVTGQVINGIACKLGEDRYSRSSVRWGTIAVHPTDLNAVYSELASARAAFISVNQGGQQTRTTALALAQLSVRALLANGYTPAEIDVILASVVASQQ